MRIPKQLIKILISLIILNAISYILLKAIIKNVTRTQNHAIDSNCKYDTLKIERIFTGTIRFDDGKSYPSYKVANISNKDTIYETLYNLNRIYSIDSMLCQPNNETGFGKRYTIITTKPIKSDLQEYRTIIKIIK